MSSRWLSARVDIAVGIATGTRAVIAETRAIVGSVTRVPDAAVEDDAAVAHELGAVHVAGGVARQERDRIGDLVGRGDAPERDARLVGRADLRRVSGLVERCVDGAGSERIDRD